MGCLLSADADVNRTDRCWFEFVFFFRFLIWGCLKMGIPPNGYINKEIDDKPLDFGVRHFQTDPFAAP